MSPSPEPAEGNGASSKEHKQKKKKEEAAKKAAAESVEARSFEDEFDDLFTREIELD